MYAEFDESPSHNPKSLILSPFFNKSKLTKEQIAEFEEKAATIEENQVSTIFKKFSRSQSIEKFKTFVNWVESKKPFSTRKIYDDIKLLKFLGHSDFESVLNESNIVSCIALSPNESYLAIGSDLAPIHLWDLTTKNSLGFLGFKEKIDKINSLVMTDFFLFSAGWDKTIRKWDLITRTLEKSYEGHEAPILCLEITKDQNYLLSGSEDRAIIIWDLYTDLKRKIPAHLSPVSCVKANPLTDSIISASWDKTIKIWSFHTIKLKAILLGHTDAIKALAVSPSGKLLASAGKDKLIKIWDLETNKLKNCLEGHQKTINVLRFSLYGDFLISGSNDKTMKLWNMNKFKLKKTIEGHTKDITGVWILSDDKKLVSASLDMTVKVWPLESSSNKIENKVEISILAIFPLQRKVLTYGNDEMIQIWDIESGKQTASIYEENGPITAVCIDSIWKTIILGDAEGFLTLRAFLSYFKLVRKASHNKEVIGIRVLRYFGEGVMFL